MQTWLAGIVLFAALTAAAQAGIVAGTVVDRATNQPIANANVIVTLESGAKPLRTTTDAAGHFMVETNETPVYVTLYSPPFDTYTLSVAAVRVSEIADLHIGLYKHIVTMRDDLVRRSLCGAFQPSRQWDVYTVTPGSCGAPKF